MNEGLRGILWTWLWVSFYPGLAALLVVLGPRETLVVLDETWRAIGQLVLLVLGLWPIVAAWKWWRARSAA